MNKYWNIKKEKRNKINSLCLHKVNKARLYEEMLESIRIEYIK